MEKRVIAKFDIEKLKAEGQKVLQLGPGDTLTPLARDTALELGITIKEAGNGGNGAACASPAPEFQPLGGVAMPSEEKVEQIVKAVMERLAAVGIPFM